MQISTPLGEVSFECPLSRSRLSYFGPAANDRFPPLVSIDMNGPLPPLATTSKCCSAARHCGHSCMPPHFGRMKHRAVDSAAVKRILPEVACERVIQSTKSSRRSDQWSSIIHKLARMGSSFVESATA